MPESAVIPCAVMPGDSIEVDRQSSTGMLYLTHNRLGSGPMCVALDFDGAAKLAEVLVPFLKNHPEIKHSGLEIEG
jgi:hypothetical protein